MPIEANSLDGLGSRGRPSATAQKRATTSASAQYADGIPVATRSLASYRELGDEDGQTRAVNNLGLLHYRHGNPDRGAACFEQALAIRRQHPDRGVVAMILGNLGLPAAPPSQPSPATGRPLAICRELGDRYTAAGVQLDLGEALALAARIGEAADPARALPALLREFSDEIGEAEAWYRLGLARRALGDDPAAQSCLREAAAIFGRLGAPEVAEINTLLTDGRDRRNATSLASGEIVRRAGRSGGRQQPSQRQPGARDANGIGPA